MGGSSGGGIIPFNMAALAPFMPSVFKGPYNAQGARQNAQMIAGKYPWITPAAGQFEGAQPGQFAGAGGGAGFPTPQAPSPPIPPTIQQGAQSNPAAAAQGQTNAMQPAALQQILSVLMAGQPSSAGGQ